MSSNIGTADRLERAELLEFPRPKHGSPLGTTRADGRLVIATDSWRAKPSDARVSAGVLSDDWCGRYAQVDETADAFGSPVECFRLIAGEHPDWDEYRDAMRRGGLPPEVAAP